MRRGTENAGAAAGGFPKKQSHQGRMVTKQSTAKATGAREGRIEEEILLCPQPPEPFGLHSPRPLLLLPSLPFLGAIGKRWAARSTPMQILF